MAASGDSWLSCIAFIATLYAVIVLVHILCPARLVEGYVCEPLQANTNARCSPLKYCLNGFRCFWIIIGGFLGLHYGLQYKSWTLFLQRNYSRCAFVSNGLGLLVSFYFVYIRFSYFLSTEEQSANTIRRAPTTTMISTSNKKNDDDPLRTPVRDERGFWFYFGREFNPRWNLNWLDQWWPLKNENHEHTILDVKMMLYLLGALVLELNIVCAVLYEQEQRPDQGNSCGLLLYAGLFTWFVLEYLWYEEVHLYTLDLFAEKIGFKLVWGCFCFYPFFYPLGMLPFVATETTPDDLSLLSMGCIGLIYVMGSVLTRGANMQKYYFRRDPYQRKASLFGGLLVVTQETVPSSNNRLLCSGFWGLARHVNYLGEILQAIALALPGWLHMVTSTDDKIHTKLLQWIPWLYPLYCVALFIPRQIDDEEMMRQKYGDQVMDEYCARVPYRIVPGLY